MWDEFNVICSIPTCEYEQFQEYLEHDTNLKYFQFLNGLNDSYSTICSKLLMRE